MIHNSQNVEEIISKLTLLANNKEKKSPNIRVNKSKQHIKSKIGSIGIKLQNFVLGFTFLYLAFQKIVYRIPLECHLIYDSFLCRIIMSALFLIIFIRIIRNIVKIFKKENKKYKILFFSYVFNKDISLQTYRYFLGTKLLILGLFFLQIGTENYLLLIHTNVWLKQIESNFQVYLACSILMQLILFDIINECFAIYGGKYQTINIKQNQITFTAILKFQVMKGIKSAFINFKENYYTYTRKKGIPFV